MTKVTITDLEVILDALKTKVDGYSTAERNKVIAKCRAIYNNAIDLKLINLEID